MEFEATLDDQLSAPAEQAAGALEKTSAASKALDAQLRKLDVAQQRTARSKEAQQKAFNPEAYKKQVKAEHDLAAAKEKALQELGIGASAKEKADEASKSKAAAKAEQDKAKAADSARSKMEKQRAAVGGLGVAAKAAALGLLAAAGASGAMDVARIAIGYRGMAQLQMVAYKAQLNLRGLTRGIDAKPLVNSFSRLTDLLNASTPTGRALTDILNRGFNGAFGLIEKETPYVEAFFQGILLGGYKIENSWLRLRIAAVPVTSQLGDLASKGTGLKVVAYGAALAVGVLAAKAAIAAAPFIALAAAITAVVVAAEQFSELQKEWDGDLILRSLGLKGDQVDDLNAKFDAEIAAARAKRAAGGQPPATRDVAQLPTAAVPKVAAGESAAQKSGEMIGQGVAEGILSQVAAVEAAGGALAAAADRGVREKAEIHSPSRMTHRTAAYMGEGAEQGLEESAPKVQKAAERSLVPELGSVAAARDTGRHAAGGGSAPASVSLHVDLSGSTFGAGLTAGDVRAQVEEAVAVLAQILQARMGVA